MSGVKQLSKRQPSFVTVLLVAVLGSGLFVAILGMIVDAGYLYLDRQTQQNNSEQVLAAVFHQCNTLVYCDTASDMQSVAVSALPPGSKLVEICGPMANPIGSPIACSEATAHSDCQPIPDEYSDVWLRVRVQANSNALRPGILDLWFPGASPGLPEGCSQGAYAPPSGTLVPTSVPIALPACFSTNPSTEVVLQSIDPSLEYGDGCVVSHISGGFLLSYSISGFTLASLQGDDRANYCKGEDATAVPLGAWLRREPNEQTDLCGNPMTLSKLNALVGTTQFLPVVGPPRAGSGGNYDFEVIGFRAFQITGAKLKVGFVGSNSANCPSLYCLSGYFKPAAQKPVISSPPVLDVPYFGLPMLVPLY